MGVPVFFKWLSMRNPKIIRDATEPSQNSYDSGNPYVDNFYIDMNGLIHPSCNPKGQNIKEPKNFEEQCENIYQYIDKLMNIVRPKKLLYLAIDGVAPRAKMNQQRSRRFRAALEGQQSLQRKSELLKKYKSLGACSEQVEEYATKKSFQSNVITPGTKFLSQVCQKLRQYINTRLQNHKFWKNLIVVFSDSNCPGEGQHKIMEFIRQQRSSENYSPNLSHCIYGADADLIMLGLASHQPRFFIIRQIVITANDKWCTNCQKRGHFFMDCNSIDAEEKIEKQIGNKNINVSFQFIRLKMVREYIHYNYMNSTIPFGYNLQRIIDDFIFLCFFVGNDFLPHVPCLTIREGGIDVLMRVYETCLKMMPDYLTNEGQLNFRSLRIFIQEMGHYEESLVQEMINKQHSAKVRQMNQKAQQQRQIKKDLQKGRVHQEKEDDQIDYRDPLGSFKADLDKLSKAQANSLQNYSVFGHNVYSYKEKYYKEKFRINSSEFLDLKHNLSKSYIEALKWICGYYYDTVPSWSWYYPFHYSPFFTDIIVPEDDIPPFEKSQPFKPFQQLMAVFPAKTYTALPKVLHSVMLDMDSPIIDYFPSDFYIDLVGKRFAWLGEVLLPFIDDKRLLAAMGSYEQHLQNEQSFRNRIGITNVYINKYGNLGRKINQRKKGEMIELSFENDHEFEGSLIILQSQKQTISYSFQQPANRKHRVCLKTGIEYTAFQQINEQFISKTDKTSFGGQRFIRVIQRILNRRRGGQNMYREHYKNENEDQNERKKKYYGRQRRNHSYDKEDQRKNNKSRSRSRSRQKRRQYHQGRKYQNKYRN